MTEPRGIPSSIDLNASTVGTSPAFDASGERLPAIDGYEIERVLGRGGMGVVYLARDVRLNRAVALKMILGGEYAGPEQLRRFRSEAETAARVRHPGIVEVHHVGDHDGRPFLVMDYCAGGSLAQQLDGTPWPPRAAARFVEQLAAAVQAAHEAGVIHRDLKPQNVLLQAEEGSRKDARTQGEASREKPGRNAPASSATPAGSSSLPSGAFASLREIASLTPKISDFGLAKQMGSDEGLTASGDILGTPGYMAPEQAAGGSRHAGPGADLYGLGAILYRLLTGRPPFQAATRLDTIMQVLRDEPVPPSRLTARLPRDLETICLKCLQKTPARRYASAADLAEDLRRFQDGRPILARPIGPLRRTWRWVRRNPVVSALLLAVLITFALGTAVAAYFAVKASEGEQAARSEAEEKARQVERVEREKEWGRRLLYAANVNRAQTALRDRAVTRTRELLGEMRPGEDEEDLRGFEWHYLNRQVHGDRPGVRIFPERTEAAVFHRGSLSADGRWAASLCTVGPLPARRSARSFSAMELRVWDVSTGRMVFSRREQRSHIHAGVSVSSSGLVAWGSEQRVTLYDVVTGVEKLTLPLPVWLLSLRLDPAGKRLLILARPRPDYNRETLQLWDAFAGRPLSVNLARPGASPTADFEFNRDGSRVFAAYRRGERGLTSGELVLWDATRLTDLTYSTMPFLPSARGFLYDPSGRLAVVQRVEGPALQDIRHGQVLQTWPDRSGAVQSAGFAPDGLQVALGESAGTVLLHDLRRVLPPRRLHGPESAVTQLVYRPDGQSIVCLDSGGWVRELSVSRGEALAAGTRNFGWNNFDRSGSRAAGRLFDTAEESGRTQAVGVWDSVSGQELFGRRLTTATSVPSSGHVLLSADGRRLVASWAAEPLLASNRYADRGWQPRLHGLLLPMPQAGTGGVGLASLWWGQFLPWTDELRVWDVDSGRLVLSRSAPARPQAPTDAPQGFSPDARHLLCRAGPRWTVWDVNAGKQRFSWDEDGWRTPFLFPADNRRLVTARVRESAVEWREWDLHGGQPGATRRILLARTDTVASLTLGRDGSLLAVLSTTAEGTIRLTLWGVTDEGAARVLEAVVPRPQSRRDPRLDLSANGRWVAINDSEQIRVWDIDSGTEQVPLRGPQGGRMLFTEDCKRLLEVHAVGTTSTPLTEVRVWDTITGQEMMKLSPPLALRAVQFHGDVLHLAGQGESGPLLWTLDGSR